MRLINRLRPHTHEVFSLGLLKHALPDPKLVILTIRTFDVTISIASNSLDRMFSKFINGFSLS
jgi:hypothetical protein